MIIKILFALFFTTLGVLCIIYGDRKIDAGDSILLKTIFPYSRYGNAMKYLKIVLGIVFIGIGLLVFNAQ